MHSPFFSIIIPSFNAKESLQDALDSVLQQDYTDLEIWVIDGSSGDGTLEILVDNVRKDNRVNYISEKDKGIYDAMNKGVHLANGSWIYFLGADDKLYDNKVLGIVQGAIQENDGISLLYGDVIMNGRQYDGAFTLDKLLVKNISHQSIFYQATVFKRVGEYTIGYKMHADWDFNIRYFKDEGLKAMHIDRVIARFGEGGVSAGHDLAFLRGSLIPERLERMTLKPQAWNSISVYDEWWRLLRNASIREEESLREIAGGRTIPAVLRRMIRHQRKLPASSLQKGYVSKLTMLLSYIGGRFTKDQ